MKLQVYEQGHGFPILCLHGHPGSGQSMSVFTDHLSKRFWTLAPDLRGYGRSKTRQAFAMTDHLADLELLLADRQISNYLILGWSLGGILALEMALRHSTRVTGLILVATAARPRGNHPPITWQDNLYTGLASILNGLYPDWSWNRETLGKRSLYRYLIQQHTPTSYGYLAREATRAYLGTSRFATQALQRALTQGYNRLSDLQQIQCPSFMLTGEADYHITALSSLETAQAIPDCEWKCYPNTAHLFPWEIPDRVRSDLDRWLDDHPQITSAH
ncbi:MAG: alpha/beta hydrolase [Leptolyngbyaceae cyanobacterium bins.59]|nr:alpha/beta hydrolase [Leptolyngbyaceae cyanobacterium bins.59]